MAARINKKRSFLFVSKVLGKHLPVHPSLSLISGAMLGCLYETSILERQTSSVSVRQWHEAFDNPARADELYGRLMDNKIMVEEPTLFIGFAETATALGHSMFDAFDGNVMYLHTTREQIEDRTSVINFEEEHSHAMSHRCYAEDTDIFRKASRIVLVDDEMTTGKTSLNIIKELFETFGQRDYVVASLLDWRSRDDRSRYGQLERELGIRIRCLSLVEGAIRVKGNPSDERDQSAPVDVPDCAISFRRHDISGFFSHMGTSLADKTTAVPYLTNTGRFGMDARHGAELDREVAYAAKRLVSERTGKRVLCMGTGEFMYIPMRIANLMGDGVYYQSTTRSPIYPMQGEHYAVTSAYRFESADDATVANFMYNVTPGQYDEAFVFIEREYDAEQGKSFERALARIGIPIVNLVFFGKPLPAEEK
ncbi:hypothetical protein FPL14_09775 [Cohnella cholangitidis]|uniref:Phosphoribosyltransferase n=2 Tax=Cohnella cholangitidis TaxID=2598458 RepID=A0A7G5C6X7_9BACL|nr:hypothetical protein FPL14_09775 [Cohnella cholangitidis]